MVKKAIKALKRNLSPDAFKRAKKTIEDARRDIDAGRN